MKSIISTILVLAALQALSLRGAADLVVKAGYLNNLSGAPNPADVPDPFDAATFLISSGGVATTHDTGILLFQNECSIPMTVDKGVNVTTQGALFQIWDASLPIVLLPGQSL